MQGVKVDPETVTLDTVTPGTPTPVSWDVTNLYGPITLAAQGGPLGSSRVERPTIADQESQEFQVEVPAGASRLDVAIGKPSDGFFAPGIETVSVDGAPCGVTVRV